jgi:hypothetical protein
MWQISEEFIDYNSVPGGTRKQHILLNADKPINAFYGAYPITWTGFVAGYKVEIIQLSESSLSLKDFEFKTYPDQYQSEKGDIVKHIDNFLKRALS